MVTRRSVLGAAGAATGAAALAGVAACEPAPGGPETGGRPAGQFDPRSWSSVKAQFDIADGYANFAAFVLAPHPAAVRTAVQEHRRGLDADPTGYLAANEQKLVTRVADAAARYLGAKSEQVAFTDSTTMGLGLIYTGLRLRPGDEVLTTEHDFYATHESLRLRAERDGVTVRKVRLYRDPASASVDEIVGSLRAAVGPATRVVAITWVHSGTGVKLPVRAIADALKGTDALLCVDAVHGFGAVDENPDRLGCDFLISGCHKWLFGPRGTGLVWGRETAWARFTPVIPTFDHNAIGAWIGYPAPRPAPGVAATPGGFHSFEHRWALAEAFALHEAIGRARVAARISDLAGQLKAGLAGIPGVKVHTPASPELSAGLVCCELPGVSPGRAVSRLGEQRIVASVTPYATELLRFGTSFVVEEPDVAAALKAVRALA